MIRRVSDEHGNVYIEEIDEVDTIYQEQYKTKKGDKVKVTTIEEEGIFGDDKVVIEKITKKKRSPKSKKKSVKKKITKRKKK